MVSGLGTGILLLTIGAAQQAPLLAQEVRLTRVGSVRLDGRVDPAEWAGSISLPMIQYAPTAGAQPRNRAVVRIGFGDDALFIAGEFEADSGTVQAVSLTRDQILSDDVFAIVIDSFDDNANAVQFVVTPAGVQADYAISDDGENVTDSWNAFWDVATTRRETGWSAEMRIPFSSLRFETIEGRARMGLIVSRYAARINEWATYPILDPRLANAQRRPSAGATVVLAGVRAQSPRYFTPYALAGGEWEPPAVTGGFARELDGIGEAGLDLKAAIGSNTTLDLTVNTDFAQVEADVQQVNLTRFGLFFPEKRQFFQERAGVFAVPGGQLDPTLLFHSRRIGLDEAGQPVRIYAGARLVTRRGGLDVGALSMQTEESESGRSENLGVLRLRQRLLNSESAIGGIVTTRLGVDGRENLTWGVDGRLRMLADDYFVAQVAGTEADGEPGGIDGTMVRLGVERPATLNSQGFGYMAGVNWSGPGFAPGLGFQPRRDFSHAYTNVRYGFFPGPSSPVRVVQPSVAVSAFWRNADRVLDTFFGALFLNYELKSGVNGWGGAARKTEDLTVPLPLGGDVVVPAGRHRWTELEFGVFPSSGRTLQVGVLASAGGFYDGKRQTVTGRVTWSPSAHLTLEGVYALQRLRFDVREQAISPDLGQLRIQYALDTRLSISTLLQYNRLADQVAGNVRARYRFAEGRDLYLVWNERLNLALDPDGIGSPTLPRSAGRVLQMKYSHALIW